MSEPAPEDRIWTPANIVTLLRICLVPVFVAAVISPWPAWFPQWSEAELVKPWVAAVLFVLLAATDGVDGYLARSRGEVTTFGKFIDPLADKILVAAALLVLVEMRVLPSWVALIILCREFIVSGIRMVAAAQGVVIAASWYGKAKTVTQIIAITLFLVKDSLGSGPATDISNPVYVVAWIVMIAAVVLTIVSMLDYFSKARHVLGFGKPHEDESESGAVPCDLSDDQIRAIDPSALSQKASRVLDAARASGVRIATAESLTGGAISAVLTSVPGSSDVFAGGVVSYQGDTKMAALGVREHDLDTVGAVSSEVAMQMAQGVLRVVPADAAVSVTGIAGPGGEEPEKPVGTVWMAVASAQGCRSMRYCFPGDRTQVRLLTVDAALDALLEDLSDGSDAR